MASTTANDRTLVFCKLDFYSDQVDADSSFRDLEQIGGELEGWLFGTGFFLVV